MKHIYFFMLLSFGFFISTAQSGQWVWIHGSSTTNVPGSFGTQGIPSQSNEPPGLYEVCEWKDHNGKFWFYGGLDDNTGIKIHNDLWKFDPVDSTWTWIFGTNTLNDHGYYGVQGVPSPSNHPPGLGYGVATWVDKNNNLWMFGGWDDSTYADMWKYDISTNIWTWMKGPGIGFNTIAGIYGTQGVPDTSNNPPARSECAATWVDNNGDLWMFGGYLNQIYNDLWRFNIATNTWTWMKGSNIPTQHGMWGVKGVENSANSPSARRTYCHWMDKAGNFWMFGGTGMDSAGAFWMLSDLWRYNPLTNNWTWMNGENVGKASNIGVFGTKCVSALSDQPAPRYENRACWTDPNGDFWMWGGQFMTTPFNTNTENDLWKYCVSSNEWTWQGGDNVYNLPGNWGTKYVPSPSNKPDGRLGSVGWIDDQWNLYLFGGSAGGFGSMYNDLWRFAIDTSCGSVCAAVIPPTPPTADFVADDTIFCQLSCTNFTDLSINATSWQWNFPGATPSSSTDENPQNICYLNTGSFDVILIASNAGGNDTLHLSRLITVNPVPPTPSITCSGDSLYTSVDPSYTSYQWYFASNLIPNATHSYYFTNGQHGNYNVAVSNAYDCLTSVGINTNGCITTSVNELNSNSFSIFPNPVENILSINTPPNSSTVDIHIYNVIGEIMLQTSVNTSKRIDINLESFSKGLYFIEVRKGELEWMSRFVKD